MIDAKFFSAFLAFLLVSSCALFKKPGTSDRIETEGSYVIVNQSVFLSNQEKLTSKIEGFVFDDYSKTPVSYGFIFSIDDSQYRATIDSVGGFQLLLPSGTHKFKITSVGNKDLVTGPIELNENVQIQLNVYLGSDIMYESNKKQN